MQEAELQGAIIVPYFVVVSIAFSFHKCVLSRSTHTGRLAIITPSEYLTKEFIDWICDRSL